MAVFLTVNEKGGQPKKKTQKKTTPKKYPFFGIKQTFGKTTTSSLLQSIRLSFWTTRSRRAGEVPHLGDVMPRAQRQREAARGPLVRKVPTLGKTVDRPCQFAHRKDFDVDLAFEQDPKLS